MNKYSYFGPVIGKYNVSNDIIEHLKKKGESARQKNNDFRKNLAGLLKEEYYLEYEDKQYFVSVLKDTFFDYLNYYFNEFGCFVDCPIDGVGLDTLWINYMQKNEFNPPHTHSGNFSFVIYLDVPEIINEEKTIARSPHPGSIQFIYGQSARFLSTLHNFRPKTGDLFIFPAYLTHYVTPFKSDVVRISMSGNVNISIDTSKKLKENDKKTFDLKHNFNKINFVTYPDTPKSV